MSHLPSCPAWGGAQFQVWTPHRPSLVLLISSFSLHLALQNRKNVGTCIGGEKGVVFLLGDYNLTEQLSTLNPWVW